MTKDEAEEKARIIVLRKFGPSLLSVDEDMVIDITKALLAAVEEERAKNAEVVRLIPAVVAGKTGWSHIATIGRVLGDALSDQRGPDAVIADLVAQYPPDSEEGRAVREARAIAARRTAPGERGC